MVPLLRRDAASPITSQATIYRMQLMRSTDFLQLPEPPPPPRVGEQMIRLPFD
jgi:hypothetical protein